MKNARVLNILSLIFNLLIVGAATAPIIILISSGIDVLDIFLPYPVVATAFTGLVALICLFLNIVAIVKGDKLATAGSVLKLMAATTEVMVVLLAILRLLAYKLEVSSTAYSFSELLYGDFNFTHEGIYLGIIVPALTLLSYIIFDHSKKLKIGNFLIGGLIVAAYFGFYIINSTAKVVAIGGVVYDWYELLPGVVLGYVLVGGFILLGFIVALILLLLNKLLGKAFYKEDKKEEEKPQAQEAREEEKPMTATPVQEEVMTAVLMEEERRNDLAKKPGAGRGIEREPVEEKPQEPEMEVVNIEPQEETKLEEEKPQEEEKPAEEAKEEAQPEPVEEPKQEEVKEEAAPVEEPKAEEKPQEEEKPAEEKKAEEQPQEETPAEEEKKPAKKPAAKKAPAKKPAAKKEPAKKAPAKKPATKKAPAKKPAEKKEETKVYHLTKRKEDGMWAITFVGGQRAVKLFKTKKEAEEYLKTLTENQGATALIRNSKGAKAGKFASSIKSEEK